MDDLISFGSRWELTWARMWRAAVTTPLDHAIAEALAGKTLSVDSLCAILEGDADAVQASIDKLHEARVIGRVWTGKCWGYYVAGRVLPQSEREADRG